jgi:hypothetical protein
MLWQGKRLISSGSRDLLGNLEARLIKQLQVCQHTYTPTPRCPVTPSLGVLRWYLLPQELKAEAAAKQQAQASAERRSSSNNDGTEEQG